MLDTELKPQHSSHHQEHGRPIRSFVLRQGRISNAQQRALDSLLPLYGVAEGDSPLDLNKLFARSAPKILEIGFGMGEATAQIAHTLSDTRFICCEVHEPGVGALLKLIGEQGLTNLRLLRHDAVEVVETVDFAAAPMPEKIIVNLDLWYDHFYNFLYHDLSGEEEYQILDKWY